VNRPPIKEYRAKQQELAKSQRTQSKVTPPLKPIRNEAEEIMAIKREYEDMHSMNPLVLSQYQPIADHLAKQREMLKKLPITKRMLFEVSPERKIKGFEHLTSPCKIGQ
jgi:uncharacterized protein YdiU (UPF0061 family)